MEAKGKIVQYIQELVHDTVEDLSINLFETGTLTSLHVLSLVSFIEKTFNISLTDDDIDFSSFSTINNMVKLIENKLA